MRLYLIFFMLFPALTWSQIVPEGEQDIPKVHALQYKVVNGKLYRLGGVMERLNAGGYIMAFKQTESCLYYLLRRENALYAVSSCETGKTVVKVGDFPESGFSVMDFKVRGRVAYFIVEQTSRSADGGNEVKARDLVRVDLNSSSINIKKDVGRFRFLNDKIAFFRGDDLYYDNRLVISQIGKVESVDTLSPGKIIIKNSNDEFQILDVSMWKNVFISKTEPELFSGDGLSGKNIFLEFSDSRIREVSHSYGEYIYYTVSINGRESLRTETGPWDMTRKLAVSAGEGRYAVVKIEKWRLDRELQRYVRLNNINQPEVVRIFVPANGIVKLNVIYDGEKYFFKSEGFGKKTDGK